MFLGTHRPRLDEKNRVILPAKFRDALADGLVMTKRQDRCLVVWTTSAFATYAAALRAGSPTSAKVRAYTRCQRCGRPRSVYKKFGLCRICLREMAHRGELPGITKSSW